MTTIRQNFDQLYYDDGAITLRFEDDYYYTIDGAIDAIGLLDAEDIRYDLDADNVEERCIHNDDSETYGDADCRADMTEEQIDTLDNEIYYEIYDKTTEYTETLRGYDFIFDDADKLIDVVAKPTN